MSLRRLQSRHYKTILGFSFPILGLMFGGYQQFLHDQQATTYRNKSKMFGGKQLPPGKEVWY